MIKLKNIKYTASVIETNICRYLFIKRNDYKLVKVSLPRVFISENIKYLMQLPGNYLNTYQLNTLK